VSEALGTALSELQRGTECGQVAEYLGVEEIELAEKVSAIQARIDAESPAHHALQDDIPAARDINLTLHVSNACNLDCLYCYAKGGDYGQQTRAHMDAKLAVLAVEKMYRHFRGIRGIMFFGGEPALATNVIATVCSHIRNKFEQHGIAALPQYKMVTNGTLMTETMLDLIRRHDIQVTVSVDGPKELHDKLRPFKNGKGSYDSVRNGFYQIVTKTDRVPSLEATYTKAHLDAGISMNGLMEFLSKEFMFTIGTVAQVQLPQNHPLSLSDQAASSEMEDALEKLTATMARGEVPEAERSVLSPIVQFLMKKATRFQCAIGHDAFNITAEGDVYPCQIFIGRPEFCMGSVKDFDPANPAPQLQRTIDRLSFCDKQRNPMCHECWARGFCFSCPGSRTFADNGDRVPESFCREMKHWVERVLAAIYDIRSNPVAWQSFLKSLKQLAAREASAGMHSDEVQSAEAALSRAVIA
jgi:uncharacterized protein